MTQISSSTVLVTGAASGIGRLLAIKLAGLGAELVLWDRNRTDLADVEQMLLADGHRVRTQAFDLCDKAAIDAAMQALAGENVKVDILINNAGIVSGRPVTELTDEDVEDTFQINAIAPIAVTRRLLPAMIERDRGHIVNIASAAGILGAPRLSVYSATKAAMIAFDESLRLEIREVSKGKIKTTVICPYFIDTDMFAGVKTRWPFLLPILRKENVVDRIVAAIAGDQARVIMPKFVMLAYLLRPLPVAAYDWLAAFFGITQAMDTFAERRDGQHNNRET